MSGGFDYIEGGAFKKPDDILIDDDYAAERKLHVGDTINLMITIGESVGYLRTENCRMSSCCCR